MFPKIGVPQNGWFLMEHPIKMYDLGVPTPFFWKHTVLPATLSAYPVFKEAFKPDSTFWSEHLGPKFAAE